MDQPLRSAPGLIGSWMQPATDGRGGQKDECGTRESNVLRKGEQPTAVKVK